MLKLSHVLHKGLLASLAFSMTAVTANASHLRHGPTAGKHKSKRASATRATSNHPRAIDDARAVEIQTALVKAGYLENASGHWDDASAAAMRKLQGDNGWQTKLIPDSRALIKLGLGPNSEPSGSSSGSGMSSNQQQVHDAVPVSETATEQK